MKTNKNRSIAIVIMVIGVIFFIVGLNVKIPSDELTTYSIFSDKYTVIEEYVGGDAYNYIIGAALTGGQIAAATISKAIYITTGVVLFCLGLIICAQQNKKNDEQEQPISEKQENT